MTIVPTLQHCHEKYVSEHAVYLANARYVVKHSVRICYYRCLIQKYLWGTYISQVFAPWIFLHFGHLPLPAWFAYLFTMKYKETQSVIGNSQACLEKVIYLALLQNFRFLQFTKFFFQIPTSFSFITINLSFFLFFFGSFQPGNFQQWCVVERNQALKASRPQIESHECCGLEWGTVSKPEPALFKLRRSPAHWSFWGSVIVADA